MRKILMKRNNMIKRNNSIKRPNKKGFTLVELLVVITIIGILMLIGIFSWHNRAVGSARVTTWEANHRLYISGVTLFMAANEGELPANKSDLVQFMTEVNLNDNPAGSVYQLNAVHFASDPSRVQSLQLVSSLPNEPDLVFDFSTN